MTEIAEHPLDAMDRQRAEYAALGRRAQRRWRSPCCGTRKPWEHAATCPLVLALPRLP